MIRVKKHMYCMIPYICVMQVQDAMYVNNNLRQFDKHANLSYNQQTIEWSYDSSDSEDK